MKPGASAGTREQPGPGSERAPRGHVGERQAALLGEVERIAHLGGFIWQRDGELHWSDELFRLLGYEPQQISPSVEAFFEAVHPDDVERVRAGWAAVCQGSTNWAEYRIVDRATGEIRFVRATGHQFLEAGEVTQIIGAVQDISEARLSALALEEAQAVAQATERLAGIGSFLLRVDSGAREGAGGSPALPGSREADGIAHFERVHPDDRDKHALWWRRLMRERAAEPLSVRVERPDGSIRHLNTQAAVLRLRDGSERIVGTTVDVTDRVQLEEQLRHAVKMEAIGTLAAGVAHDFNNYLLVLDQSLSMLLDGEGEDREELVESGRLALSRSRDLTRQLLAFARRQPFSPESIDLAEVVRRFQELLSGAVGRRATLRIEQSRSPLWCRVDPHHVERMLTNLVVNAADAIEDTRRGAAARERGHIAVRLDVVDLAAPLPALPGDVAPGAYVCVSVEDDGGGIEPSRLPYIFEPYFTTKAVGRGTGLGLASVYGMARQNGGQVTVGAVTGGTRFVLWFPRIAPRPASAAPLGGQSAALTPASHLDHHILIVEDMEQVRDIAQRILRAAGFRTSSACHGQEALELLDSGCDARLILSDLEMPVMGGRELARQLQRRPSAPPVIFMTGYSEEAQQGELGGMLLAKPFTPERLLQFVKRALSILGATSSSGR